MNAGALQKSTVDKAKALLTRHEGRKKHPYVCPADKISVGIGRNLEDVGLHADEIDLMFKNDLRVASMAVQSLFRGFHGLDDVRQTALLDMAFNMGQGRLSRFEKMRAAIDMRDFRTAADECLDSNYARQVPRRAKRIASMLRTGIWPPDISFK